MRPPRTARRRIYPVELAGRPLSSVALLYGAVQLAGSAEWVGNAYAVELECAIPPWENCTVQVAAAGGHDPEVNASMGDAHRCVGAAVRAGVLGDHKIMCIAGYRSRVFDQHVSVSRTHGLYSHPPGRSRRQDITHAYNPERLFCTDVHGWPFEARHADRSVLRRGRVDRMVGGFLLKRRRGNPGEYGEYFVQDSDGARSLIR
jgi:hypothetical protein